MFLLLESAFANASIVKSQIQLGTLFQSIDITEKVEVLEDTTRKLTIDNIITNNSLNFKHVGNNMNFGYKKTVYWFKFNLVNKSNIEKSFLVEFQTARAGKDFSFYVLKKNSQFDLFRDNAMVKPAGPRKIKFNHAVFPIGLKKNSSNIYYVRIENKTYFPLNIVIWPVLRFQDEVKNTFYFSGLVFGIIMILAIYNFGLYFSFKDISYLFYILFIVTFLFQYTIATGLLLNFFPELQTLGSILYISAPLLMAMTLLMFAGSFLKLSNFTPRFNIIYQFFTSLVFFNIIIANTSDLEFFMISRNILCALTPLLILFISIYISLKKYRPALFFLGAMLPSILLATLPIWVSLNLIPPSSFANMAVEVGMMLTVSLFSFVLLYRVNTTRKEKETAQQQVITILKQTEKLKDEFLANTSHELRTPLNGIIGIADSMINGITGKLSKPVHDNLNLIILSGRRLANLVNDILDFAKLKNKELTLHKKPTNIYVLVDLVIPFCLTLLKNKEVRIINKIPKETALIFGDEDRLQQILYNLLGNAVKFTNEGTITITAEENGGFVEVSILDTGIGIEHKNLDNIFEEFVQVDSSMARKSNGTGIGLPLTKKLIELHAGNITVQSIIDEGSQFTFSIPKATNTEKLIKYEIETDQLNRLQLENSNQEITDESLIEQTSNQNNSSVLIVDDDPVNLIVMSNYLSLHNYRISKATCGSEALKIVNSENKPDLILLDLMMPDMNGFEVTERLRKTYTIQQLPIIIITAKNRVSDFVAAIKAGANDYMVKPSSSDELITKLKLHEELLLRNMEIQTYQEGLEQMVKERTDSLNQSLEEVKEARTAAEKAYEVKSLFLANMSHELRTPMQGVLGFANLGIVKVNNLDRDKLSMYFKEIYSAGKRLLTLLNSILDMSKLESGKSVFKFEPENLSQLAHIVIREFYAASIDKGILIVFDKPDFQDKAMMDVEKIMQVIRNLISNAMKFSKNESQIKIEITQKENHLLLSVFDTGVGIPKDELISIFDTFVQSSKTNTNAGGTGLGLSICKEIIEGHNGNIWAENNLPEGSVFKFLIPTGL